jgi:DNA-binding CsgD family transcriptional regulator/tetratricopeptide (TPR) repeat protein
VAAVAAGRGGAAWVEGEPGIGKSAVVTAGIAGAAALGCAVFWGAADPLRGRFPLGVMLDGLGVDVRSADGVPGEIARLLRGEGAGQVVPGSDVMMAVAERLLVHVDRLCAASPVVLVIDDLQWADEVSVSVWHRLAAATSQVPLLMVGVARPVPTSGGLAVARRGVLDRGGLVISVRPLPDGEVAELVGGLVGGRPGAGLLRLAGRAGGNPLYLRELVDALVREDQVIVTEGVAELADGAGAREPVSLGAAIEGRLGFLSDEAMAALRVAALLGVRFSVRELAVVADLGARELVSVVSEAVAAGVLVESGLELMFRHGLIAQALVDGMPAGLRAQLRSEAARLLAGTGAAAERVARLLLEAGPDQPDEWVLNWLSASAVELVRRDPRGAADLLARVVAAAPADPPDGGPALDPRWEILAEQLAVVLFLLGRHGPAEPLARRVLATSSDAQVRARMAWTLSYTLLRSGRPDEALEIADRAARDPVVPEAWQARLLSIRGLALLSVGRYAEAEWTAAQALADAQRAQDTFAAGYALHVQAFIRGIESEDAASLELTERALALIGAEAETSDLRLLLLSNRLTSQSNLGLDAADAARELLRLAEQAGTARLGAVRWSVAEYLFQTGQWDDALAELSTLLTPGADLLDFTILGGRGLAALIAGHRDDDDALRDHLDAAVDPADLPGGIQHVHGIYRLRAKAVAAEREGHPEQALRLLTTALTTAGAREPPELFWGADLVRCALASGDLTAARAAVAHSEREGARRSASAELRAIARWCRGVLDADRALLTEALGYYRGVTKPLPLGQVLEDLAVAHAVHGDLAAARMALREAVDVYTGLGANWDIARADGRLRSAGVRRSRSGKRRPATGWAALTPTEIKVARLVAEGLSNPEVGGRLFLSRYTVQTHVAAILTKLQIHSRVGIAAEVASHPRDGHLDERQAPARRSTA